MSRPYESIVYTRPFDLEFVRLGLKGTVDLTHTIQSEGMQVCMVLLHGVGGELI